MKKRKNDWLPKAMERYKKIYDAFGKMRKGKKNGHK